MIQYISCSNAPPLLFVSFSLLPLNRTQMQLFRMLPLLLCKCFLLQGTQFPTPCWVFLFNTEQCMSTILLSIISLQISFFFVPLLFVWYTLLRPFSRFALVHSFLAAAQNIVVKDVKVQPTSNCYMKRTNAVAVQSLRSLNAQKLSTLLLVGAAA